MKKKTILKLILRSTVPNLKPNLYLLYIIDEIIEVPNIRTIEQSNKFFILMSITNVSFILFCQFL